MDSIHSLSHTLLLVFSCFLNTLSSFKRQCNCSIVCQMLKVCTFLQSLGILSATQKSSLTLEFFVTFKFSLYKPLTIILFLSTQKYGDDITRRCIISSSKVAICILNTLTYISDSCFFSLSQLHEPFKLSGRSCFIYFMSVNFALFQDKQTTVLNGAKKQSGNTIIYFHCSRNLSKLLTSIRDLFYNKLHHNDSFFNYM